MMNIIAASRLRSAPLVPSYLSLDKANEVYLITNSNNYIFLNDFFVEVEFTYNSLTSSYAGVLGFLELRLLINNSTIIVTLGGTNLPFYNGFSSSFGEIIKIRIERNLSGQVFLNINDSGLVNIGNNNNRANLSKISQVDSIPRYLDGNLYSLNVNGEIFELNEGSGNLINGSNGNQFEIFTSSTDPNYIDSNVWVNL